MLNQTSKCTHEEKTGQTLKSRNILTKLVTFYLIVAKTQNNDR